MQKKWELLTSTKQEQKEKGDRKMKCDYCGKSAKTLFKKLLYRREFGCEMMFYYCPKCYKKIKKMWKE